MDNILNIVCGVFTFIVSRKYKYHPFLPCPQEAIDCVREMKCPGKMNFLVSEAINHSLEKSNQHRQFSGRLFSKLLKEHLITKQKFMEG